MKRKKASAADALEYSRARKLLQTLPWRSLLPKSMNSLPCPNIYSYASHRWLSDEHISQMTVLLNADVKKYTTGCEALLPYFFRSMRLDMLECKTKEDYFAVRGGLQTYGKKLAAGELTRISFNVNKTGNHWTTVLINCQSRMIGYGDAYHLGPPAEMVQIVEKWLSYHVDEAYSWEDLPCITQSDSFSCGIWAVRIAGTQFCPSIYPVLSSDQADQERVRVLNVILEKVHQEVCSLFAAQ
ncbi:hypothetical protein BDZ89DRAFT_969594 [Hymenopellis radicata]|nr:hypothetical protein BDZ89DRAFT_969594 [Hymenopellis radicata]